MDHSARLVVGLRQAESCAAINHRLGDGTCVAAVARLRVGSLFARDHNPCLGWIRFISAFHRDLPMAKLCAGCHRLMRYVYPGVRWRHVARGWATHALYLVVLLVGGSRPCVMAGEREHGGCVSSGWFTQLRVGVTSASSSVVASGWKRTNSENIAITFRMAGLGVLSAMALLTSIGGAAIDT